MFFKIKAPKPLAENQSYWSIPNLKNEQQAWITVSPTQESIKDGHLIFVIPDNQYNKFHIQQHYPHYKEMMNVQEIVIPVVEEDTSHKINSKINPFQMKQLKMGLIKKLTEIGVEYSKDSSLEELEKLVMANSKE